MDFIVVSQTNNDVIEWFKQIPNKRQTVDTFNPNYYWKLRALYIRI